MTETTKRLTGVTSSAKRETSKEDFEEIGAEKLDALRG